LGQELEGALLGPLALGEATRGTTYTTRRHNDDVFTNVTYILYGVVDFVPRRLQLREGATEQVNEAVFPKQ
jgi:hypothetical protein